MALSKLLTQSSRLLLLAALLLSGCFRPAGDSIEPTSDFTAAPLENADVSVTPEIPAITMLSPETNEATEAQGGIALTQITLEAATITPTPIQPNDTTATLQIITPGISLGLVTPDTPTPLPSRTPTPIGGVFTADETDASPFASIDSGGECTYTVQPGDSLYQIAINNDTTVANMQDANPDLEGDPPILQIGDVLNLPDCAAGTPRATSAVATTDEATTALPPGAQIYVVQSGDVLGSIASRFGVTVNAIMRANDMNNPDVLSIGQELIIPEKAN